MMRKLLRETQDWRYLSIGKTLQHWNGQQHYPNHMSKVQIDIWYTLQTSNFITYSTYKKIKFIVDMPSSLIQTDSTEKNLSRTTIHCRGDCVYHGKYRQVVHLQSKCLQITLPHWIPSMLILERVHRGTQT